VNPILSGKGLPLGFLYPELTHRARFVVSVRCFSDSRERHSSIEQNFEASLEIRRILRRIATEMPREAPRKLANERLAAPSGHGAVSLATSQGIPGALKATMGHQINPPIQTGLPSRSSEAGVVAGNPTSGGTTPTETSASTATAERTT